MTLMLLVAADVAGAIVITVLDIVSLIGDSPVLAYAIWLVLGVFCGLFTYSIAGDWASAKTTAEAGAADWSSRVGAGWIGLTVMFTSLAVIAALAGLFYWLYWRQGGGDGDRYVPDSAPHSIVFFLAVAASIIASRFIFMPTPPKPPPA